MKFFKKSKYKTVIDYTKPTKTAILIALIFLTIGIAFNAVSLGSNLYFVSMNTNEASLGVKIIVTCFFASFGIAQVLAPVGIKFSSIEYKIALYCILPICFSVSVWSNLGNVDEIKNLITNKSVASNTLFNDAQDNETKLKETIDSIKQNLKNYQLIIDDKTVSKKERQTAINDKSFVDRTQLQPANEKLEKLKTERQNAEITAKENSSIDNIFLKYLIEYKIYIAVLFEIFSFIFVSVALNIFRGKKVKTKILLSVNEREQNAAVHIDGMNERELFADSHASSHADSCKHNENEREQNAAVHIDGMNEREQISDTRIAVNSMNDVLNLIAANKLPTDAAKIIKNDVYAVKKGLAYKAVNKLKTDNNKHKKIENELTSNIILLPTLRAK